MSKIAEYELISGKPFKYGEYSIVPPVLNVISDKDVCGYNTYLSYLFPFCVDKEALLEEMNLIDWYNKELNDQEKQELTVFKILILSHPQMLTKAIQFFVEEKVVFDQKEGCFCLYKNKKIKGNPVTKITDDNFLELCDAVCQVNYRKRPENENIDDYTFRSEKSKQKYLKFLELRKEFNKVKQTQTKQNEDFELGNVIASLCAKGVGYTLVDVNKLTVYQVYDQFYKTIKNNQVDAYAQKWAAWGTKDFDFATWYHKDN